MKPFCLFLTFLALTTVSVVLLAAKPSKHNTLIKCDDTSDYKLQIIENKISPLKDTVFHGNKCWITHCPLVLTNNSDYTLHYLTATASWWDIYALDNNNFELAADYWDVFKNGIEIRSLSPNQSITVDIRIITHKDYNRGGKLRIAMSVQKAGPYSSQMLKPKTVNQIWSNEVTIR
ncbi:MAG: hypothetical protein JO080_06680 [Mucilaginibacter sp.]|nr:hypothetical protein [Mucilaginibacter sp.]